LLLVLVPAVGLVPARRDLFDFFAPMRGLTAEMLRSGVAPWINFANGCGEAWFANPETAVLYPPAWLHLILPMSWALAAEIGLHLALLSLGVGLLARDLGASRPGRLLAEVSSWSAGPVMVTVGVLNNLETLTWLPWMVYAARLDDRRSVPLLAGFTALGWLGGEPQIWAIGVALVVVMSRRRARAALGLALGVAVVAVQLVPFLVWALEGDRGTSAAWLLRGAVAPADWSGIVVPGLPSDPTRMVYAESFFLGAPLLLCALLGAWRRRWVMLIVAALAMLATLPEIGFGGLFVTLTGGLVRYPSRFALVGLAILVPLIGQGADRWLAGRGRWLAVALAVLTLALCALTGHPWRWWVAGIPAFSMLVAAAMPARRTLRAAVLFAGGCSIVVTGLPLLGLRPVADVGVGDAAWPEAANGERLYVPTPAEDVMSWLAVDQQNRRIWPVGYLNLDDGLVLARTDSPIAHRRLAAHISTTDEGPAKRWWLDTLAAGWIVLPSGEGLPDGMEEVADMRGMRLLRNHRALPVVSLADRPPEPDQPQIPVGRVVGQKIRDNACSATLEASEDAYAWLSLTPVSGWRWRLNDLSVELQQGPGIVQYLDVPKGKHLLTGHYRPPGHLVTTFVSGCALLVILVGLARMRWDA
jgi:hypothetical protein